LTQLIDIFVPDIGDYKNVAVIEIAVKPGDEIKQEATLITLETDKAAMDIPSTHAGIVKSVYVNLNGKVSQGDKIISLEISAPDSKPVVSQKPEAVIAPVSAPVVASVPAAAPAAAPAPIMSFSEVHAGPATRRVARELGVDLSKVSGTGRKNRIMSSDVFQFVKSIMTGQTNIPGVNTGSGLTVAPDLDIDFTKFGDVESKPLLRIKKLTAANLHRNWVKIPHVTQFEETDVTELELFRQENQAEAQKRNLKLTPLVFIIKAVVSALKAFPQFNASLSKNGEDLILKKYINVGVAVDTPNGLVVPVVKQADTKSLFDLAHELAILSQKAREGKLTGQDMQGGCFTISSLGGIGGTMFTPIINAPELAILGISKTQIKPVWNETTNSFVPRKMLPLSLSYDHRVIDGAEAARFIVHLAKQLQDIRKLLL
jgi:pyruvate dehydrogenase E2 component (dihydrolipoamide acetyltransferase)